MAWLQRVPSLGVSLFLAAILLPQCGKSGGFSGKSKPLDAARPIPAKAAAEEVVRAPSPTPARPPLGPCEGKGQQVDLSAANKKVLFYAPADGDGGSPYYLGVMSALEAGGYTVARTNQIDKAIIDFDACKLWASYKQIWMWIPCRDGPYNSGANITRSMNEESAQALEAYYKNGGGLVVFTDFHYNNSGGIHCGSDTFALNADGTGKSRDVDVVSRLLGVKLSGVPKTGPDVFAHRGGCGTSLTGSGYACLINATGNHMLSPVIGRMRNIWWTHLQPDVTVNGTFTYLDAEWETAAIIERRTEQFKSMALVMTGPYGYEFSIKGRSTPDAKFGYTGPVYSQYDTQVEDKEFIAIADYFENNLRITGLPASKSVGLIGEDDLLQSVLTRGVDVLADASNRFNVNDALASYRQQLTDDDPLRVGFALRELVKNNQGDFIQALAYLDHPRFPTRMSAAMAIASLPNRDEVVAVIRGMLKEPTLSKNRVIGFARALMIMRSSEAIPELEQVLKRTSNADARGEVEFAIKVISGTVK